MFRNFISDNRGSMATAAGVLAIPLLVVSGFAADYAIYQQQRGALQDAADAAALASVKELSLNGSQEQTIKSVAENFARSSFGQADMLSAKSATLEVDATPDADKGEVKVELSFNWSPFMAHLVSTDVTPIKVSATAGLAGDALTCIIGLMQPQRLAKSSIHIDNNAKVVADDCSVFSNSVSRYGLRADANAEMEAGLICSAGGVLALSWRRTASFTPTPITDCPKIEDPLIDRPAPNYGACTQNNASITSNAIIDPSVFCGGLRIGENANVEFKPGVYIIKDGPLEVSDTAKISGEGVTFFLTGLDSTFNFGAGTTIDLSAPETGTTAGLLIYEDQSVPYNFDFNPFRLNDLPGDVRMHRVSSNDARNLLGTIYLPKSILLIDANAPVADASAYTAIIVGRLWLQDGPTLTINANYTDTQVPVPDGLLGKEPKLVE